MTTASGWRTRARGVFAFVAAVGVGGACGGNVVLESSGGTGGGAVGAGGAGASGTSGSGGGTSGSGAGASGTGGTGAACPVTPPAEGSPCGEDTLLCDYPACTETIEASCAGTWAISIVTQSCVCPEEMPVSGTSCNTCCTAPCPYPPDAGCAPTAVCSAGGTWTIEVPPCPPPLPVCADFTTPPACQMAAGCRWLVPGCGTTTFSAGCFDAADCTPGSACPSGMSCVAVDTDPCWDSNCVMCSGGQADICAGPG